MVEQYPTWNLHAQESNDGLHLWVFMPGLDKEDVRVSLETSTILVIKGQAKDGGAARRYWSRVNLSKKLYDVSQIKAEMSNGSLKLFVPHGKNKDIVITDGGYRAAQNSVKTEY